MSRKIQAGQLVDIRRVLLTGGERAEQVPADTAKVDLVMKVKGILQEAAEVGEECTVETAIGRRMSGTLIEENPPYRHHFGAPIPELMPIGRELRALLREGGVE